MKALLRVRGDHMLKHAGIAITLIGVAASTLLAQTPPRGTRRYESEPKANRATAQLTQIERAWHLALEKNDIATLDRLLAPKWFITNGSGNIIGKSELLDALRAGEIKFVSTA